MARFVLVHGAFGGAWAWADMASELESFGHEALAIDLPGGGDDRTPIEGVTLESCAQRVREALEAWAEPSILVGHSMGGVVITQAATLCPERVALLVFIAAFMPGDGQSLLDLTKLPEGAGDQVQANITVEGDPPVAKRGPGMGAATAQNLTPEQLAYAEEHYRDQAVAVFATPVSIPPGALDAIKRVYVHTTEDRAIPPALQQRMMRENPCVEVVELATDHAPNFSMPTELLAALLSFADLASTV
ncbi:MAG TPA: alpha/beta fold hydrolase [Solirubrobacteraceae bacterium]|nr:alpha/beta fold hydrolase [Solirubrobacteraceae bacterium]